MGSPPMGCCTITRGRSGNPRFFDSSRASATNASVQIVTVGMPFFSSSTESWIHHDVQLPQSPMAVMTAPTSRAYTSSFSAPTEALGFCFFTTPPNLYCFESSSTIRS